MSQLPWPGPEALLSETWTRFRARFGLLMAVAGVTGLAAAAAAILPLVVVAILQYARQSPKALPWAIGGFVSLSAGLWLASWAQVASCDAALREDPDFLSCLKTSWPRVAGFSWVCLLYMIVVTGGFFVLLAPGVYLGAALAFAPFIYLDEGVGGVEALKRSLDYSNGRWSALAGRLLVISLLGALPGMVPVVGPILAMLLSPLPLVAMALLYRHAKQGQATAPAPAARWPLALGLVGWLLPIYPASYAAREAAALWPLAKRQAQAVASLDPQHAQSLLLSLESGQSTPEQVLVEISSAIARGPR